MEETKRALSVGQTESAEECAGARIEGERNSNPQKVLYHGNRDSSIPYEEYFPKTFGMGIPEKKCAWCGKVFCPTPEWAYGDCCIRSCLLRYEEQKREQIHGSRDVVMYDPITLQDIRKFHSAREAADEVGLDAIRIRNVCNGLAKTAGGMYWRWEDEIPWYKEPDAPTTERRVNISVYITESTERELVRLAKEHDVTRNRMASIMVEKAIENKEYEI
jgi:hypothetical protein